MIKTYANAAAFLAEAEEKLLEQEAVSQLILANAIAAPQRACSPDFLFGTVWSQKPVLTFCNCQPYNLCIHTLHSLRHAKTRENQEKNKRELEGAVRELADYIAENNIPIKGINGNGIVCESFVLAWQEKGLGKLSKRLSMDIMECRKLKEISFAQGTYRSACASDTEWILKGCLAFEKEALNTEGNPEEILKSIEKFQIGENRLRLFCLPDVGPVCMANRARALQNGFVLNQVYTLPEYRGKGYAQTLIYKMCEEFFNQGYRFATLFVDKTNPVSNRVYAKAGFEILEDNYEYIINNAEENGGKEDGNE